MVLQHPDTTIWLTRSKVTIILMHFTDLERCIKNLEAMIKLFLTIINTSPNIPMQSLCLQKMPEKILLHRPRQKPSSKM
jgi:hypothetical protein